MAAVTIHYSEAASPPAGPGPVCSPHTTESLLPQCFIHSLEYGNRLWVAECPVGRQALLQAPGLRSFQGGVRTWESCFSGSKYCWQQTFIFKVGNTYWPFKELQVLGKWGEEDPFLNGLCARERKGPASGMPAAAPQRTQPRSLVLQVVFERLRQGQGADVLQALAAQGQADGSPAQVHQRQGLGCNEREAG